MVASFASLLAGACGGEQAFSPRDASALTGVAGSTGAGGKGGTGIAGSTGVAGSSGNTGGAGDGGDGGSSSGSGGTGAGGTATGSGGVAGDGGVAGARGGSGGAGGVAGARGGSGGSAGTGGTGKAIGESCEKGMDCASTFCFDGVCCLSDCTGTCKTCKGASPGTCVLVPDGMDPRDQCPDESSTNVCGKTGSCNGSGSCRYAGSAVLCDQTAACDAAGGTIVKTKVCNGAGTCGPGMTESCNGFRCSGSPPMCGSSCTNDAACATGAFCSAGACVAIPNVVGNGDLETGTTIGWIAANGGGATALSSTAAGGFSHTGGYSIAGTNRVQRYHGPGYNIPTGPGKYVITGWAMQKDLPMIAGLFQLRLACRTNINPGYYEEVHPSGPEGFSITMNQNVWTLFSGTIDTSLINADCMPNAATPGLVRLATLYLNHDVDSVPSPPYPDLYLDDVVVQVVDGHNLVGNPNFEAGFVDGWSLSTGSSSLEVSTTVAHTGTRSLHQYSRSIPAAGPRYALTNGAARYDFSFWVKHNGPAPHDLILQPTYSCINPPGQVTPPTPIKTEPMVAADTWIELKGTGAFPPADAPAGCKLSMAAVYVRTEGTACTGGPCPDLFIDDVSITLTP